MRARRRVSKPTEIANGPAKLAKAMGITRAHYGVRTRSHKLLYFWKENQWELFDLIKAPGEMKNLYG